MKSLLPLALLLLIGCSQPKAAVHKPISNAEGSIFMDWLKNNPNKQRNFDLEQFRSSGARLRIENGEHPTIQIKENAIFSRIYKWKLHFKYPIFPIFENDTYIVLSSGSQADTIRPFSTVSYQWWVVRKTDGQIVNSLECIGENTPKTLAVISNCLYLYNPDTNCLWALPLQ